MKPSERKQRLVIVDDHAVFASTLGHMLQEAGFIIAGRAATAKETTVLMARAKPDCVLLDPCLANDENGLTLIGSIRKLAPNCRILVCSTFDDPLIRNHASEFGADGFISKSAEFPALVAAIRQTLAAPRSSIPRDAIKPLSPAESRVLRLLAQGISQKAIAADLNITPATVATHIQRAKDKTGSANTLQMITNAFLFLTDEPPPIDAAKP